jgi:hypothetical protein
MSKLCKIQRQSQSQRLTLFPASAQGLLSRGKTLAHTFVVQIDGAIDLHERKRACAFAFSGISDPFPCSRPVMHVCCANLYFARELRGLVAERLQSAS